eukprot:CAMPEP_0114176916 /NCGR_PEP_ID=MMETSP0043_2-20121206/37744_1 /TAXON_ID=464988 /ORGANISM="Hemiselmis andersenii, Strain CCMP644" /LENGTH=109 /DNA_ID=CAMNT_0001275251 /DNA_START=208 /DNA_END=535 /DNA_ORIENTATION=+
MLDVHRTPASAGSVFKSHRKVGRGALLWSAMGGSSKCLSDEVSPSSPRSNSSPPASSAQPAAQWSTPHGTGGAAGEASAAQSLEKPATAAGGDWVQTPEGACGAGGGTF